MFARAVLAFLALPAVLAGAVPWLLARVDPWRLGGSGAGIGVLFLGGAVVAWCARDFYVAGRGTLAPWAPPTRLVVVGLYRWVRNPMYLGVLTAVLGSALAAGSPLLAVYTFALGAAFHLRVVRYEEPWLAARFASDWAAYRQAVPRWLPARPRVERAGFAGGGETGGR